MPNAMKAKRKANREARCAIMVGGSFCKGIILGMGNEGQSVISQARIMTIVQSPPNSIFMAL